MSGKLEGRVALITGAASGIGRAIAQLFAAEGALIAAADLNLAGVQALVAALPNPEKHLALQLDVRDVAQIYAVTDQVVAHYGRLDILVPSAGVIRVVPFLESSEDDWDFVTDINQKGVFFSIQAAGRHMARQRSGAIVTLASIAGRFGSDDQAIYCASKAAVISMTRSAALALAPYGVRVNALCPGLTETPMWEVIDAARAARLGLPRGEPTRQRAAAIPLGVTNTPEDVARVALFFACDDSRTITGQALNIDGGFRMD
jgi:D-sorbitol dehydrogenase (acceptor)